MLYLVIFCIFVVFKSCQAESSLPICSPDEDVAQRQLCKLTSKYPNFPFIIQPQFDIQEVLALSGTDRSMTISVQTVLTWNDTAVKVEGPNPKKNFSLWFEVDGTKHSELFIPILSFLYQRQNHRQQFYGDFSSMYQYFWHLPPHHFEYAEFHTITIGCQLTPENFPFDSHTCPLTCFNPEKTLRSLEFLPPLLESRQGDSLKSLQIEYHGLNFDITVKSVPAGVTEIRGYSYSTTGILFMFRRNKVSTIITGYYLPSGLYSLLSGLSFSIPKEQLAGRMGMMVTLSLISTNSYNSLEAPEDRGISFLEVWMLGTHFPIIFAISEYGIILSLDKFKIDLGDHQKWDRRAQILFIGYQLIFQGIYWMTASQHF